MSFGVEKLHRNKDMVKILICLIIVHAVYGVTCLAPDPELLTTPTLYFSNEVKRNDNTVRQSGYGVTAFRGRFENGNYQYIFSCILYKSHVISYILSLLLFVPHYRHYVLCDSNRNINILNCCLSTKNANKTIGKAG